MQAQSDTQPEAASAGRTGFQLGLRQLAIALGFALTAAAAHWGSGVAGLRGLEPYERREWAQKLHAYAHMEETPEVLVLGSSRVEDGFDGRLLERSLSLALGRKVSCYKLGLPGLLPKRVRQIATDHVLRKPPSRVLVVGIETRYFTRPNLPEIAGPDGGIQGEWKADERDTPLRELVRGLRALWFVPWMLSAETRASGPALVAQRGERMGFDERRALEEQRVRAAQDTAKGRYAELRHDWREDDRKQFEGALEALAELDCAVVFVRLPLSGDWDRLHIRDQLERFEREIVPLIRARGFAYHDLNAAPYPLTDEFYWSSTHLNLAGAVATTREFSERVLAPLLRAPAGE